MVCSVIIPTWNRGESLIKAVSSALAQGDIVQEVLIMDNNSQTDFQFYLEKALILDDRVKVYRQSTNIGPSGNWLSGLRKIQCEWVKFLFSDDWLEPMAIRKLWDFKNRYNLDVVVCSGNILDKSSRRHFYNIADIHSESIDGILKLVCRMDLPVSPTATLLRTSQARFQLESGYLSDRASGIGPDLAMIYGTVASGARFGFTNERLVNMSSDGTNISSADNKLLSGYYAETILRIVNEYEVALPWKDYARLWKRVLVGALPWKSI
jgi:glycosyltransferase involved in cell wall biosynthesis